MAKLGEIIIQIRGVSYNPQDLYDTLNENSIPLLRANNIQNGNIVLADIVYVSKAKVSEKQYLKRGDILICTSSGSKELVGKAAFIEKDMPITFGAFCKVIRPIREYQKYIGYFFQSPYYRRRISELSAGANINNIRNEHIENLEICLPKIEEQQYIAAVLDKVTDLIAQRRAQLDKLDLLIKSRFVEMFGDPVDNSRGWDTIKLKDIGTCKNGMNFHTDNFGVKIHCLGVADFKDKSFIEGTSQLAVISLNEMPTEEYLLKNRDIVFVRSNGNKSLVGRSVMVYPGATPTTFSGFCIRFRLQSESLRPIYLLRVLKTDSVRKKLAGRGANIQNLNQKILLELSVPIPPLELQDSFENFEKRIVQLRAPVRQSLNRLEILKISLMQQYFG